MKKELSKSEVEKLIETTFKKDSFSQEEIKKIKKLAMKYRIRLKEKRKSFCKKCLSQLKGKIRIKGSYKTIECSSCGYLNRIKIN